MWLMSVAFLAQVWAADVPPGLKDGQVTVKLKNGYTETVSLNDYKLVKRVKTAKKVKAVKEAPPKCRKCRLDTTVVALTSTRPKSKYELDFLLYGNWHPHLSTHGTTAVMSYTRTLGVGAILKRRVGGYSLGLGILADSLGTSPVISAGVEL